MKKLKVMAAAVCALALAACMLAGCSSNNASNDKKDAAATSSDKTTLIVGFDQSYPPYGFVGNDGNFTGFDLDLAVEVASRNGWDIQLEPIDWDAKDTLLNSGAITCIWNGFTMEGRENDYTFSDPYMLVGIWIAFPFGLTIAGEMYRRRFEKELKKIEE